MKAGTCKHFNGIQNDRCQLGVVYDRFRVKGTAAFETFPCFGKCDGCDKREYPTQKDLDDFEKETELLMQPVLEMDRAVNSGETEGSYKHEACGGTIRWTCTGPLQLRAKCDKCEWSAMS